MLEEEFEFLVIESVFLFHYRRPVVTEVVWIHRLFYVCMLSSCLEHATYRSLTQGFVKTRLEVVWVANEHVGFRVVRTWMVR